MYRVVVLIAGLMLAGLAQPTFAQDYSNCLHTEKVKAEARIAFCTTLIESGRLEPEYLATAYFRRAYAWTEKGDKTRAIADYSESLRLNPNQSGAYNNRGLEVEDDTRAIADFTEALALDPSNIRVNRNRGHRWDSLGEYARAIEDYTRVVDLDPRNAGAYRRRGYSQFNLRQYDLAALDFREVLDIEPAHAYATIWRYLSDARVSGLIDAGGELEARSKSVDRAKWPGPVAYFLAGRISADELRQSAKQGDAKAQAEQTCEVDFYLGQWHVLGGRADEAGKLFERAVATCPKSFIEYRGAVAALKPAGDGLGLSDADRDICDRGESPPDDLIAACTRIAASGQPAATTLAGLYHRRGQAFAKKENWQRAIADFTEALRRDPENARVYADRGDAWHAKGDTFKAMADYNASLHLAIDATVYARRANAWHSRGVYGTAIADFTKAIELDPGNAGLFLRRGLAWEKKGDAGRAFADYDESIRLALVGGAFHIARGQLRLKQGQIDLAISDFDAAIRLDPDDETAYSHRGTAQRRQGALEPSFADFDAVIRLNPEDGKAYEDRGKAAFLLGRFDDAADDFAESRSRDDYPLKRPLTLAWRYLALAHGSAPALARGLAGKSGNRAGWEFWIHDFLIGAASESFLRQSVQTEFEYDSDAVKASAQRCQVEFYVGQKQLLDGRPSEARALLQHAVDTCPKDIFEYAAAVAELRRLGPG